MPHLDAVDRVLREDMTAVAAEGETLATVDETRPLGRLAGNGRRSRSTATSSPCGCGCSPRSPSRRSASRRRRSSSASSTSREREQFGKKIGTYQAVSHPLADTYVETELARSLAYWAAWCVAEDDEQAPRRRRRREGAVRRDRGRRLRALDPGARRHRLHLGAPLHRYYKRAQWIDAFGGHAADAARRSSPRPCSTRRGDPCPSRKRKCSS